MTKNDVNNTSIKRSTPISDKNVGWCVGLIFLMMTAIGWWAMTSPVVPLLTPRGPAQWIVFPLKPMYRPRVAVTFPAQFRRQFILKSGDAGLLNAHGRLRAMRQFRLTINDQLVGESIPGKSWKKTCEFDATPYLHVGVNHIQVDVENDQGPPALWMAIDTGQGNVLIGSDTTWQVSLAGSHRLSPRLATEFTRNSDLAPAPQWHLSDIHPIPVVTILIIAGILVVLAPRFARRIKVTTRLIIVVTTILWAAMFINNAGVLHPRVGFDAAPHLAYIQYLLDNHELPHITQGFETNQPPLYYMISAASLKLFGLETTDGGAAYVLRALGLVAGVIYIVLIFAVMQLIFPGNRRRALIGWLIAVALPMHLYLFQYVTNEWLLAVLAAAAFYVGLLLVVDGSYTWRRAIGLGVLFGASLLTKLTAIVPVAVIVLMIGWSLLQRQERNKRIWLRVVIAPVLIAVLLGGWHYGRSWKQTGSLFVTTNQPASGLMWWQDPGYTTPGYFLRFDNLFTEPFYSGFRSFPCALYTTLFGDGMLGSRLPDVAPGWNYTFMMVGYILSILPAVALALGIAVCVRRVLRRPDAVYVALLLMPLLMFAAMLIFTLRIANFPGTRAFYGISVAASCCALAAWGLDLMINRWRVVRWMVCTILVAWAICGFATFWIHPNAPSTRVSLAVSMLESGRVDDAIEQLNLAVKVDPANKQARLGLITIFSQIDRLPQAWEHARQLLNIKPDDPDVLWAWARLLSQENQVDQALIYVRKALTMSRNHPKALLLHAELLDHSGATEQAIEAYRLTLTGSPDDMFTHKRLAKLYQQADQPQPAQFHADYAAKIQQQAKYFPASH